MSTPISRMFYLDQKGTAYTVDIEMHSGRVFEDVPVAGHNRDWLEVEIGNKRRLVNVANIELLTINEH